jgi:type II secretory ATPase GspE/PulE/Tfp pilus assembly ATPase PilB-like protein
MLPLNLLGMLPNQIAYVQQLLKENKGVVLLGGDRHQGVPATRYALLQDIDPYTNSVVTIEEQVQTELEGVEHHRIEIGMPANEFNQKLGQIIRADPNVLMLSRIADGESCKLIARSAHEMRFLVPMPQGDTMAVLKTWVKVVGEPKLAADALVCVMAQRLVRRLCTTCRIPYTPDPSAVKKLNLPPDRVGTLYKASGRVLVKDKEEPCPDCRGLAYRGRLGVFEVMPLDDNARGYIAKQQWDPLQTYMRKQGMIYLQEAALAKVVEGITDIKEVQRALKKEE